MIPQIQDALNFVLSDKGNFCANLFIVWGIWLLAIWIGNATINFINRKKGKQ